MFKTSLKVLELLELDFLKSKAWKTLENSNIPEVVIEKCLNY